MKTNRICLSAALAAAALGVPMGALAQDTPWLVRVRAVYLDMANKDSTGLDLSLNNKLIPEVDISYFFTPSLAAELILTYPQKHTIRAGGSEIGSLKHLPPTLTLQYHFGGLGPFKPYVGAGINYTRFSSVKFDPAVQAALQPSIEKSSVGFAVQAGVDYALAKGVSLNFDVKKIQIRTDVMSAGTKVGEFKADPWLVGAGVGWQF
ncbi:OmpW/AlkL family protein [Methylibium sp.]|uniref:OmpW/AlkL family protein n=1 Tax=Methylibium sp. TaxID=2067992 RepID=UPI003D0D242B